MSVTVWVTSERGWESEHITGVFSSLELAKAAYPDAAGWESSGMEHRSEWVDKAPAGCVVVTPVVVDAPPA